MTYNQFEKQLHTWRREMRAVYDGIMMLADSFGLLTKRGKISKDKKKKKQYDAFISRYKQEYGSYSTFIKKQREKRKKAIEEYSKSAYEQGKDYEEAKKEAVKILGKNAKEYYYSMLTYNLLITEMFEIYLSKDAYGYLMYAETLPLNEAIDYLYGVVQYGKTHDVTHGLKGIY